MRKPKLSGVYYAVAPTLLDRQIQECFKNKRGPGDLPIQPKGQPPEIQCIIVPKYQYEIAGPCAAWSYKQISESGAPDVIIILGQTDKEYSGYSIEPFETPYGIVRVDQVFARALGERKNIHENNAMFDDDEQIESQLPLIQFAYKKQREQIKIVPILLSTDVKFKELAVDIKEILLEQNKKAVIIVPTNFTYYGSNHGYVPFGENAHKKVYELDKGALELIEKGNPTDYLEYVDDKAMNTDNYLGIVLAMLIIKPKKVLLENYYTTADVNEDYKNFISFAAMVLK